MAGGARISWRESLTLALWFYPCWWAATAALQAASRLVSGRQPGQWRVSAAGLFAGPPMRVPLSTRLAVALALAGILVFVLRRRPAAAGIALVTVSFAAAAQWSFDFFRPGAAPAYWAAAALLAAASLGVRLLVSASWFGGRIAQASVAVLVPLAAMLAFATTEGRGFRPPWEILARMLAMTALPAILFGCIGRSWGRSLRPHWAWMAAPVLIAGAILGSARSGERRDRADRIARIDRQLNGVPKVPPKQDYPKLFFQRGVSFLGDGRDGYFPEPSARMLDGLKSYGVDSIALVPYGNGTPDGEPIRFDRDRASWPLYEGLGHLARARGMRVLLKPQIWARGFPGNIEIADPRRRREWFDSYGAFIEDWAKLAARMHADLFCVGTEFVKMSVHEAEWRAIVARVRAVYPGPLVYAAAQGPEFENLRFWDALDYVGLNNYYPLPDTLETAALVKKVEAVQSRFGKPVLLTEAGFASVKDPHREPWSEPRREPAMEDQARCYEAILRAFHEKPWFQGIYWWKVSTDGRGGSGDASLTPWGKPAMDVVGWWYRGRLAAR